MKNGNPLLAYLVQIEVKRKKCSGILSVEKSMILEKQASTIPKLIMFLNYSNFSL